MKRFFIPVLSVLAAVALMAETSQPTAPNAEISRLLDRIVEREQTFLKHMAARTPLVETYIQEISTSDSGDDSPGKDHYFLGRFQLEETIVYEQLIEHSDPPAHAKHGSGKNQPLTFLPRGFAQMAILDLHDFNRRTYSFDYVRREFLGEVRCLVFDVAPLKRNQPGRFLGRIWVEDRDDSIVRFDGIYVEETTPKGGVSERYFHFDSWRVNVAPGEWMPAQIYVEEEAIGSKTDLKMPRFKAQTRIWDYSATPANRLDELTNILIERESGVEDQTPSTDVSPLESQRSWERQAEDNILARLQNGGLLAPPGPVDEVLGTVVNNLIVSANLNLDARCRVLLTTPIETFSVGHTIVISRGLIDVLPDETSLALVLAAELSHIALGHRTPTQFAFHNQTMLTDAELLQRFRFDRSPRELADAGKKAIEIMRASQYQNAANAALFLKALASQGPLLPRLLAANLGNQIATAEAIGRLSAFTGATPGPDPDKVKAEDKLKQIAALPLGSRVKLNPWNNRIELIKSRPLALSSPREKMPFEVTPFVLHLTRVDSK